MKHHITTQNMHVTRSLCAFVIISGTILCGYFWDQCVPFFPTDVSVAATGHTSRHILSLGGAGLALHVLFRSFTPATIVTALGLIVVTKCTMLEHEVLHVLGLIVFLTGAVMYCRREQRSSMNVDLSVFGVFLLLWIMPRLLWIIYAELDSDQSAWSPAIVPVAFARANELLLTGNWRHPEITPIILKCTAVVQWCSLIMVARFFDDVDGADKKLPEDFISVVVT